MFKSIINIEEFEDLIQQDKLVVVDFWAELSSTSSFMGPIFKSLADQNPEVDFGHVDKHAFHPVAASAGVTTTATYVYYRNGQKVGEIIGARLSDIIKLISKLK